jgi:hypothetical protein
MWAGATARASWRRHRDRCGPFELKSDYTVDDLQERVAELCENGNEEIAYEMLRSGKAYSPDEAAAARAAKERYADAAS